jgi:hypothetical protein
MDGADIKQNNEPLGHILLLEIVGHTDDTDGTDFHEFSPKIMTNMQKGIQIN